MLCVITGGTGGIGWYLSTGFAERGYKVVALDYMVHRELPDGIEFKKVDLSNEMAIYKAFSDIAREFGEPHVLINNAGILRPGKYLTEVKLEDFDKSMAVNVRGAFVCCQEFVKANDGAAYGRIINISSTRWHQNEANWEVYGATKGAIVSLTNSMCVSLGKTAITVNCISPGWIETVDYDGLREEDHKQHPSGRVGLPRDILNAALFLADEENGFVNGANLVVDGGMTKKMIYLE